VDRCGLLVHASTCFANLVIAIARSRSDTIAGIRPAGVPAFIVAQFAGAVAAMLTARAVFKPDRQGTTAI
jgi:glycerol uptake facilitator-like aquaporin